MTVPNHKVEKTQGTVFGMDRDGVSKTWKVGMHVDTKFDIESSGVVMETGTYTPAGSRLKKACIRVSNVDFYGQEVINNWFETKDFWQSEWFTTKSCTDDELDRLDRQVADRLVRAGMELNGVEDLERRVADLEKQLKEAIENIDRLV